MTQRKRNIIVVFLFVTFASPIRLCADDPKEIFRQAISAVVLVETNARSSRSRGFGSGFVVGSDGVVVTNRHVLTGARDVSIKLNDGSTYPVTGVYFDPQRDVCLLKADAHGLPVLSLADSDSVSVGEKVYTIGSPLGLTFTFSDGMISGKRVLKDNKFLQFTAPVSPGNSGGPLLNSQGKAVGIVTASTGGENLNFALAIDEVKPLIAAIATVKFETFASPKTQEVLGKNISSLAPISADDRAIEDYTARIELNIKPVESYNNRGLAYSHKGQYDQAIADFSKALEFDPSLVDAYCNRAAAYITQKNYTAAVKDCSKAIKIDPSVVAAYHNRAIAYLHLREYGRAIKDCSKAIALDLALTDAYNNRAVAYYRKRNFKKAWSDVHKVTQSGGTVDPQFLEQLKKASGREH